MAGGPTAEIQVGDCREVLRSLPAESVHCVVTSPPYWQLRDYGLVARRLGRAFTGVEIKEEYAELARRRIAGP